MKSALNRSPPSQQLGPGHTPLNDCKGNTPNARLIACLQPDRRVELQVTGTR